MDADGERLVPLGDGKEISQEVTEIVDQPAAGSIYSCPRMAVSVFSLHVGDNRHLMFSRPTPTGCQSAGYISDTHSHGETLKKAGEKHFPILIGLSGAVLRAPLRGYSPEIEEDISNFLWASYRESKKTGSVDRILKKDKEKPT